MRGPIKLVRSIAISSYENLGTFYDWSEESAYLMIDRIQFNNKQGAILAYYNPPVHQVGNPALDAYLVGLEKLFQNKKDFDFLVMTSANDPVHAGGDLKESLSKLDKALEIKKEKEAVGEPGEAIDRLFEWADTRIQKGAALHKKVRTLAQHMRVDLGGRRIIKKGGSAEIPLMADYLVGDSRSGMCFSEAMIGLIPGWAGVARMLIKSGAANAEYMAMTSEEVKASDLLATGAYNVIVDVPFPFPKRVKTDNPQADKKNFLEALEKHNEETGALLIPKGLDMATCPEETIPVISETERKIMASKEAFSHEVDRRKDPLNYSQIWGKPLKEAADDLKTMGRPLAPQSIEALNELFIQFDPSDFDEYDFVEKEGEADSKLYRDSRFRAGLVATLEQRVADYREV
jgi:enoyl-CoA hydratase/carnithine racemase